MVEVEPGDVESEWGVDSIVVGAVATWQHPLLQLRFYFDLCECGSTRKYDFLFIKFSSHFGKICL